MAIEFSEPILQLERSGVLVWVMMFSMFFFKSVADYEWWSSLLSLLMLIACLNFVFFSILLITFKNLS